MYDCVLFKDKMCNDVDKQEKSDSSDYETDEEWEIERKKQQAAMDKDAVRFIFLYINHAQTQNGMGEDCCSI